MWKIIVGFIAFAALALYVLSKGGDIDMGGESMASKHLPQPRRPLQRPARRNSGNWLLIVI